jgi:poly(3-hydroxyalkanoate) synthetase
MVSYNTKAYARRVKVPLLAISAIEDGITPASKIHDAMDGMPNVEFKDFSGSHFGLFGESLGETVVLTTAFLKKHL